MPSYRVRWEIDIDADNPVEAAKGALETMRDPGSEAVVFNVAEGAEPTPDDFEIIDLERPHECEACGAPAYFEHSPEGQNCAHCGMWLCDDCTDWGDGETPYCENHYPVKVVFRKCANGDIVAAFPEMAADADGNMTSYMHVGQHSACTLAWLREETVPATPAEYAKLEDELVRVVGYNLKIAEEL